MITLMMATGWLVISARKVKARDWPQWLFPAVAAVLVWRTKIQLRG